MCGDVTWVGVCPFWKNKCHVDRMESAWRDAIRNVLVVRLPQHAVLLRSVPAMIDRAFLCILTQAKDIAAWSVFTPPPNLMTSPSQVFAP